MPVEVVSHVTRVEGDVARLSSFGFSGTIAHAAFSARKVAPILSSTRKWPSLYRSRYIKNLIYTVQRSIWLVRKAHAIAESS